MARVTGSGLQSTSSFSAVMDLVSLGHEDALILWSALPLKSWYSSVLELGISCVAINNAMDSVLRGKYVSSITYFTFIGLFLSLLNRRNVSGKSYIVPS